MIAVSSQILNRSGHTVAIGGRAAMHFLIVSRTAAAIQKVNDNAYNRSSFLDLLEPKCTAKMSIEFEAVFKVPR